MKIYRVVLPIIAMQILSAVQIDITIENSSPNYIEMNYSNPVMAFFDTNHASLPTDIITIPPGATWIHTMEYSASMLRIFNPSVN